ncbi:MAG TPA: sensor domain-containing protein, partial [Thermoleophilia bacterium]|nr:sensor domain-containing protein [Thermoleophilia bacterium]
MDEVTQTDEQTTLVQRSVPQPTGDDRRGRSWASRFFGVIARPASWTNLVYLALTFPLGLFYFVFLVTMLSVGIGLVIVWVGIFILGLTAACWWAFAAFERHLADGLLGTHLAPSPRPWEGVDGTWSRIKAHFSAGATWKDLVYLFLKFPLGVATFVIVVTLGAASLSLIGAPFYYRYQVTTVGSTVHHGIYFGVWTVDHLWEALVLVPIGVLALIVSFHAFNGLASMWRALGRGLLPPATGRPPEAAQVAAPPASLATSAAAMSAPPAQPATAVAPAAAATWDWAAGQPARTAPPSRYAWPESREPAQTKASPQPTPSPQSAPAQPTQAPPTQPTPYAWPSYPSYPAGQPAPGQFTPGQEPAQGQPGQAPQTLPETQAGQPGQPAQPGQP